MKYQTELGVHVLVGLVAGLAYVRSMLLIRHISDPRDGSQPTVLEQIVRDLVALPLAMAVSAIFVLGPTMVTFSTGYFAYAIALAISGAAYGIYLNRRQGRGN